jgi:glycosyltransferase involved in cell wall biosynthesis
MTAAYNEEANMQRTIEAVLAQTQLPARWVIVSDGSMDRTDEIVRDYAKHHEFIRFCGWTGRPAEVFDLKWLHSEMAASSSRM